MNLFCQNCGERLVNGVCASCPKQKPQSKQVRAEPPRVLCAYEPCPNHAICKVRHYKTGAWVNVCELHYLKPFREEAADLEHVHHKQICQERTCHARALPNSEFCPKHHGQDVRRAGRPQLPTSTHQLLRHLDTGENP